MTTAVAGALAYVVQLLAPALLPSDTAYITFSVYWSTLYLGVAALSGIQQEVTRASRPVTDEPPSGVIQQFTWVAIAAVVVAVTVFTALWGKTVLPEPTIVLAAALGVGLVGYVLVAVLSGVLYGLRLWTAVAGITLLDSVFRTVLVVTALIAGWSPEWVALAISIPFGLAFLAVWVWTRKGVVGAFRLDVSLKRLLVHVTGTVLAAASMGVIMNGFPLLLGLTASGVQPTVLAGLILAITLTRAPIVIPLLALQSYMITRFRGGGARLLRRILVVLAVAAAALVVLAGLAALIGPAILAMVSAGRYDVSAGEMAVITASAGGVAMMSITGPALLSQGRHTPYVSGWVVTAALTIVLLALPVPFEWRMLLALLVPPALGLSVHLVAIGRGSRASDGGSRG